MEIEKIYNLIFEEIGHHPLTLADGLSVMQLLRRMDIRENNMKIMEGYNASERIAAAYSAIKSQEDGDLRRRKRDSMDIHGGKAGKVTPHKRPYESQEGDEGGV